jgi:hypothetical protein
MFPRAGYLFTLLLPAAPTACSRTTPASLASFEGEISMHTDARGAAHDMIVKTNGTKLRFDTTGPGGEPTHAVFDPATNKVQLFVDAQKRYLDLDFSAPSAAPSTDPTTSTVTKSGKHRTVAGYDCEAWTVQDSTGKRSDVCIAQGIAFFDVSSLRPGGGRPASPLAKKFRDEKSFPLESIDYDAQGKELSHMQVTKIEKKKFDDSVFAIPPDYLQTELPRSK